VDQALFPAANNPRPYKVRLPNVVLPIHHYNVRLFLIELGWEEFTDWMICPYTYTEAGEYEVWFADIGKATYFKLSFTL
jgi:hypothetical protein